MLGNWSARIAIVAFVSGNALPLPPSPVAEAAAPVAALASPPALAPALDPAAALEPELPATPDPEAKPAPEPPPAFALLPLPAPLPAALPAPLPPRAGPAGDGCPQERAARTTKGVTRPLASIDLVSRQRSSLASKRRCFAYEVPASFARARACVC